MFAIFRKEVALYFLTPFGYLFASLFLFLACSVFIIYNLFGSRGDIYGMLGALNFLSIVAFPILTMRLLAEEKRMATDRLLFTSPVTPLAVVLGKYFAALFVFLLTLAITGIYVVMVVIYGQATPGAALGSFIGFFALGGAYIAICLFASSLTENQVTAVITGFGFLLGFWVFGFLAGVVPVPFLRTVFNALAILNKFEEFATGLLKIDPIVYYLSFAVAFLFFTVRIIEARVYSQSSSTFSSFTNEQEVL